jgi:TonB-dependent receptor
LEWYFAPSSYVSVGFFDKRVKNFVGTGQTTMPLFGLRDPSSGAAGTRSGDAADFLTTNGYDLSDVNLFTMTALIDQMGQAAAEAAFTANLGPGGLDQGFVDATLAAYDVVADGNDPLYQFQLQQPVNSEDAHIYGFEIAGQYFLGDTGLGVAGAYTLVRGDIGYDITAAPTADQFALLGLSDTFNASLIYENYGFSARLTYNWRDTFLTNNSRGSSRNPVFVDAYDQLDLNISYDINDMFAVSFEGINLTGSNTKTYARTKNQPWFIVEGRPRYYVGARVRF